MVTPEEIRQARLRVTQAAGHREREAAREELARLQLGFDRERVTTTGPVVRAPARPATVEAARARVDEVRAEKGKRAAARPQGSINLTFKPRALAAIDAARGLMTRQEWVRKVVYEVLENGGWATGETADGD